MDIKLICRIIPYVIYLIALIYAGYTDAKENKIKIWLFPLAAILSISFLIINILNGNNIIIEIINHFIGFILGFVPFYIIAKLGKGGGGDAIMCASIGLIFGLIHLIELYLLMSGCIIIYYVIGAIFKNKTILKKQIPMAPFMLMGFILDIHWILF